jgi:hypothetical protein
VSRKDPSQARYSAIAIRPALRIGSSVARNRHCDAIVIRAGLPDFHPYASFGYRENLLVSNENRFLMASHSYGRAARMVKIATVVRDVILLVTSRKELIKIKLFGYLAGRIKTVIRRFLENSSGCGMRLWRPLVYKQALGTQNRVRKTPGALATREDGERREIRRK